MNDLAINNTSLRETYSAQFFSDYKEEFEACLASNKDEFVITSEKFDDFVFYNAFTSAFVVMDDGELRKPTKNDDLWERFRGECNRVRRELNHASTYAVHGEPPFRLDYEQGTIVVRLLTAIFRVTAPQIAEQLNTMITNKERTFDRITQYFRENIDSLPPELRGRVDSQKIMFEGVLKRAARDLSDYVENTKELYDMSVKAIADKNGEVKRITEAE